MPKNLASLLPDLEQRLAAIPASPQLRFLPIRHHSPAVSQHLKRLFKQDQPQEVLIEAPENLQPVIPYLADRETRPPVALYCYHQQSGNNGFRARAYFPLARFSPEWVVLKLAVAAGASVRFIDAPYTERSVYRPDDSSAEDGTLQDEHDWHGQQFTARILQATGCRDIDELWDRWFESRADDPDGEGFFRDLTTWCLVLRNNPRQGDDETAARERCMASHIRDAVDSGRRLWVVTGGYHSEALALNYLTAQPRQASTAQVMTPNAKHGVALIPYSLQRLDRANHYGAGLPDCGYYNALWNRKADDTERITTDLTLQVADTLRAAGEQVSLSDCIEATAHRQRLASLRGVRPGRMEWRDSLQSCLNQVRISDDDLLEQAVTETLQQEHTGKVCSAWPSLPMVEDFRQACRQWGLPLSATAPLERQLDIYRSQRHRDISAWLHQLAFLGGNYGTRVAGPDFVRGKDLQRVREIWSLQWQPEVEAHLTEQQHFGTSIAEAAANRLLAQLNDPSLTDSIAGLLPQALQMGLRELITPCLKSLDRWLNRTTHFESLVRALERLVYTDELRRALLVDDFPSLQPPQSQAYRGACTALSWIDDVDPARIEDLADAIRQLGALTQMKRAQLDDTLLLDELSHLLDNAAPRLAGLACGLLYQHGRLDTDAARRELFNACRQAWLAPNYIGEYLTGLLSINRTLLTEASDLLHELSTLIASWDENTFLKCLPGMRLAFTALKPRELNLLGERLEALFHGTLIDDDTPFHELKPELVKQAESLLTDWGW